MKKRMTAFLLTALLLTAMLPLQAAGAAIPTAWTAPGSLIAAPTGQEPYSTSLFFSVDSALLQFIDPDQTDHEALGIDSIGHTAQVDWKLNNGAWHYTSDWDTLSEDYGYDDGIYSSTGYLTGETTQEVKIFDLRNGDEGDTPLQTKLGSAMIRGSDESGYDNRLDLENNTFSFRVRFLVSYFVSDAGETRFILSPWSQTLTYGKGAAVLAKPTYLTAPVISDPHVGTNHDGSPNITFTAVTPSQVQDANNYIQANDNSSLEVQHQININNTGWAEAEAGAWWLSGEQRTIDVPVTYDNGKTVEVDSAYIQLRMRYVYPGGETVGALQSDWSNVISLNTPAWSNASTWATGELQQASDLGLIPDLLKGADMTKSITREEFCELAVLLYEKATGKTAAPASPNPFTDTTNERILKAFSLGITTGTSATTFSPNVLVTREQCATMLFRAIRVIAPEGDYSIAGIADFPDQKDISSWASDGAKYMAKLGIIKGNESGRFMPRGTTTAQQAAGYGMASREAAVLMSVRTYQSMQ